jgi:hypothetical protein
VENPHQVRLALSTELESIVAADPASNDTKLARRVALKIYDEFRPESGRLDVSALRARLAGAFGSAVVENRFLEPARDRIMDRAQRNAQEQFDWVQPILRLIEAQSKTMLTPLFDVAPPSRVRAPRRLTPRRKNTLAELKVGLRVQE